MSSPYITRGHTHVFWHADLTCSYTPQKRRARAAARKENERLRNGLEVPKEVRRVDSANLRNDIEEEEEEEVRNLALEADRRKHIAPPEEVKQTPIIKEPVTIEPKATSAQIIKFLLSDAALEICRPEDENKDVKERGSITTYSELLTPFEELLCAVILSRQIPHNLSLRTIRTVLSPPYGFRSPVAIKTAGAQKIRQSLWDGRTPHKGKTAEEINAIAEALSSNNWHNDLSKIRKQNKGSVEAEREVLRRSIKGLGKAGLETFYRRIQWQWEEAYPFVDSRTQTSLEKLGLPKRPESIVKMIEVRWDELNVKNVEGFTSEEQRRRAFVVLLERAIGADLEKNIDVILREASKL